MTKILISNGDWDGARAKLKSTLETQNASFNAQLQSVFARPKPQEGTAGQKVPVAKRDQLLARSQKRG